MKTAVKEYQKPFPRPYQVVARDNFLAVGKNALIKLPTGTGKTQTSVMVSASDRFRRVLFLAHTGTLVWQTCRAFLRNGIWPSVEKADEYRGGPYLPDQRERRNLFPGGYPPNDWFQFGKVVVSTIQTFVDRVDKYQDDPFDLIICDEVHRALARTWLSTIEKLIAFNPSAVVCGLSATPMRGDGQSLAKLFPGVTTADGVEPLYAYRMDILDAIDEGWLVPITCERATLAGVDESMWKVGGTRGGRDITDESLSRSMNNEACIESIAHEVLERADGRKGILFLPGVAVTESVAAAMNELRPGCAVFVHGKVPKKENKKRIRMIEDGDAQFILGCDQLIEGFDVPDIALVVMARYTAQRGRYEQMLGRGLRVIAGCIEGLHTPAERRAAIAASGKPDCKVLDFSNNSRFKLVGCEDILLRSDDQKMAEYVKKHRDPADKRALREQLEEQELMYLFEEALRKNGGPPKKENFAYERVNLFGVGGYQNRTAKFKDDVARPSAELVALAYDLMVTADPQLSHNRLAHLVEQAKNRKCGRKAYGFLLNGCKISKEQISGLGINWHDAQYLRKLFNARPTKDLPDNWADLLAKHRKDRGHTNTGGAGR